jgi:uncharacterized protein YuzE
MSNLVSFHVAYDSGSDVLYINLTKDPASRGVEDKSGIVWRYNGDGKLIGATVMDYYDRWTDNKDILVSKLSKRFHVPVTQMEVVLSHVSRQ